MNNNPSDPKYWEALGITPIVINPDNDKSVDDGFAELTKAITEIVQPKEPERKKDK